MKDNHHTYYEEFLSSTECKELSELALREEPRVMGIDNPYRGDTTSVSYTHLTLPTKRIV